MFEIRWLVILFAFLCGSCPAQEFRVGAAIADITPGKPTPMWGYGARHSSLSQGTLDPLRARAIVIEADGQRLAIVGADLGRGPTMAMMKHIRERVAAEAKVQHVMISGSHTHHGPVIELTDREGYGKGKYDDAVAYAKVLPDMLSEVIIAASKDLRSARIGTAAKDLPLNRNRHSKKKPAAVDPRMTVMRFDDIEGKPIAVLVNWTAHPVMTEMTTLKFSADYPGFLADKVAKELGAPCVFMQGASGDLSPNAGEHRGPELYGKKLADHVLDLARSVETKVPDKPSIASRVQTFSFASRIDFSSPAIVLAFGIAFFPELVRNFAKEFKDGIPAELIVVLLNGNIALVGGSGEFFCNHANRLRERVYLDHTLFFGYCNGHGMYFPTIEAVYEGGYGADKPVSPAEIGAGEKIMNAALLTIFQLASRKMREKNYR